MVLTFVRLEEPSATAQLPVVYSIQEDGKRLTRIVSGSPPPEGEGGGGFGFGGGISDLNISRDGRTLFFKERDGIYSVPLGTGAATTGATTTAAAGRGTTGGGGVEGARRRISFNVRVKINRPAE